MIEDIQQLAQAPAVPVSFGDAGGFIAGVCAAAAGIWAWFRSELASCRRDRKELYSRIEQLHAEVAELSLRVGRCERPTDRPSAPLAFDPCDWRPGDELEGK